MSEGVAFTYPDLKKIYPADLPYTIPEVSLDKDGLVRDYEKIQFIPPSLRNEKVERDIWSLYGMSGSGKSSSMRDILNIYRGDKIRKGEPFPRVYVITNIRSPKNFGTKNVTYIDITTMYEFVRGTGVVSKIPQSAFDSLFRDAIVVFDDYDTSNSDMEKGLIYFFRNKLLEEGRHLKTTMIVGQHEVNRGKSKDGKVKQETTIYAFFQDMKPLHVKRLLMEYIGLGKDDIRKIASQMDARPRQRVIVSMLDHYVATYDEIWKTSRVVI